MNLQITKRDGFTVASIHGRIDTINAGIFETQLMHVLDTEGVTHLVLDCAGLDYISSSGLRIFLVAQKKVMSVQGKLLLSNMQPAIKEIFDISGFSTIFSIFPDTETAVKSK
jgi:anti-sigma B factor antagonist